MVELPKVIHPLGRQAGQELDLANSLQQLSLEIFSQRSGLVELARDPGKSEQEQECFRRRAVDLERVAVAIQSLALQLTPEKFSKATHEGFLSLARQNSIALPSWMKQEE